MKRMSIKLKITLWFTLFMILLSAVVFVFIAIVSNSTETQQARGMLTDLVDRNVGEIDYDDGELEIDDDFVSYQNGIYCLLFYENGNKISGYSPYEKLETLPFEDKNVRTAEAGGESYAIYDRHIALSQGSDIWIRGIVSEGGASGAPALYTAMLISLPLLIVLAAAGGYLIAGRSLRPIRQIRDTATIIEKSGDLSKRIPMSGSGDELHQLAGAFNGMFDRLELNFEAERHFTSDASHELRTPVSVILAQCEYAFENAKSEEELYEALGAIQKQGYRMSRLIDSLLQFTRMEQQTESLSMSAVDISLLTRSICEEQSQNPEKNISLSENIQPAITLRANRDLFARMLVNLIRNAYKYGRENGKIEVSLRQSESNTLLSVADDGIGIPPSELPNIWNRFYRVDKSRNSASGAGLGLGLAIVKQIAVLHGGDAFVESNINEGSIFTITLPQNDA